METALHQSLKAAAARWLHDAGCCAVALEVRCPISRYRVDAAGYADPPPTPPTPRTPPALPETPSPTTPAASSGRAPRFGSTIFIECKASRCDFLRDTAERPRLLAARERLHRELDHVQEEFVKPAEPHLRRSGTFLFSDMEAWSFEQARSPVHRALIRELRRIDSALHTQTKFFMLAHYRLAARLYLLAPRGVVEPTELPRGWGLLTPATDPAPLALPAPPASPSPPAGLIAINTPAIELDSPMARRLRTLRNIAAAASRATRPPPVLATPTPAHERPETGENCASPPIAAM